MSWFAKQFQYVNGVDTVLRVVQLTDCHLMINEQLYEGINPVDSLIRVLKAIDRIHCDVVVITGDISQDHTAQSYQLLAELCQHYLSDIPVLRLAGNHDEHASLTQWLSNPPFIDVNRFQTEHWDLLLVDTKGPTPAGFIDEQHMLQIEAVLAGISPSRSVGIFCHHHPLPVGANIDKHILQNGEALLQLLSHFQSVKFIAHGHVHQQLERQISRPNMPPIALWATPSTSMQFARAAMVKTNHDLGPGFRQIELFANGKVATEVIWPN